MSKELQILSVVTVTEEDLAADRADVLVSVSAASWFFGNAAFEKAKELQALVASLQEIGVGRDAVSLEAAQADVNKGLLTQASSATYQIRIALANLQPLAGVLGAITSQKQATLRHVQWYYPENAIAEGRWLALCGDNARLKGEALAASLRVRIVGIHRAQEQSIGEAPVYARMMHGGEGGSSFGKGAPGGRGGSPEFGFAIGHKKRAGLQLRVDFVVEPI